MLAALTAGVVLGASSCSASEDMDPSEEVVPIELKGMDLWPKTLDVPAPSADQAAATAPVSGRVELTDGDGYTFDVEFTGLMAAPRVDPMQAPPGETDVFVSTSTTVEVRNTTPGREASVSSLGNLGLAGLWPKEATLCSAGGTSLTIAAAGQPAVRRKPTRYCAVELAGLDVGAGTDSEPGTSPVLGPEQISGGPQEYEVELRVAESQSEVVAAELASGPNAWVLFRSFYPAPPNAVQGPCGSEMGDLFWQSQAALRCPPGVLGVGGEADAAPETVPYAAFDEALTAAKDGVSAFSASGEAACDGRPASGNLAGPSIAEGGTFEEFEERSRTFDDMAMTCFFGNAMGAGSFVVHYQNLESQSGQALESLVNDLSDLGREPGQLSKPRSLASGSAAMWCGDGGDVCGGAWWDSELLVWTQVRGGDLSPPALAQAFYASLPELLGFAAPQ